MTSPRKSLDLEKEGTMFGQLSQIEVHFFQNRNKLQQ